MVIIAMSVLQKFIITGTSILLILPLKVDNKKVKHARGKENQAKATAYRPDQFSLRK